MAFFISAQSSQNSLYYPNSVSKPQIGMAERTIRSRSIGSLDELSPRRQATDFVEIEVVEVVDQA